MDHKAEYRRWLECAKDIEIQAELKSMDETEIKDAFSKSLVFGTGGLRNIMGPGTDRINIYTISRASRGLSKYLLQHYGEESSVVIGFDTRRRSDVFARIAAKVFAAYGIQVYTWKEPVPVSVVAFSVISLRASAGVMITASHNPAEYNGYKVYGNDGCQITPETAKKIQKEIERVDLFADEDLCDSGENMDSGRIRFIAEGILDSFINAVREQSVLYGDAACKDLCIVYSPLNGTGYIPVMMTLKEDGYTNVSVVEEQQLPDGDFPTCPYPNPEAEEAMDLAVEYGKRIGAELVLATDPDCDRVGVAVKDENGEYVLLSANETGILLLDYICSQRRKHNKMPDDPVAMKTIVTTDLGERIARYYGVRMINVLTGFKFIGEQICRLEEDGRVGDFIFGFEESYGYLTGGYMRDKDGVGSVCLICEMTAYYKAQGLDLLEQLQKMYDKFGYCLNTQHSYQFKGADGFGKMQRIMTFFRQNVGIDAEVCAFAGKKVAQVLDYETGIQGLPKSNVIKFLLEGDCSIVIRPSGTEPKLKVYLSVSREDKENAEILEKYIAEEIEGILVKNKEE